MAAVPSTTKTLIALSDFDLLSQLPAVRERRDRALLRWVDGDDGRPMLVPVFSSWLTPCDRIGLLFGSRELFLEKVCEIAQEALSAAHQLLLSQSRIASIHRTVHRLNEKIDGYNAARCAATPDAPTVRHLVVPAEAFHVDLHIPCVCLPRCGLSNPGNACYLISTIIGLCGSEQLKLALTAVAHPTDLTILLQLALRQLETASCSSLSFWHEPFYSLIGALGSVFEPLRQGCASFHGGAQQDAQELLSHLLEGALQTTSLIQFREIVQRRRSTSVHRSEGPEETGHQSVAQSRSEALSEQGAAEEQHEPAMKRRHGMERYGALPDEAYIPSIDGRALTRRDAPVSTTNILPVTIPKLQGHVFPLERIFSGVPGQENVEVEAVLSREENAEIISPQLAEQIRSESAAHGGNLDPVPVIRYQVLCGEPPPVLPLQLIRFKTEPVRNRAGTVVGFRREKIKTHVDVPFHLVVPVLGRDPQRYALRAVVAHLGECVESGHYVACMPDPHSSLDVQGMPSVWKYYNDGHLVENRSWDSLATVVRTGSYLLIYDRAE